MIYAQSKDVVQIPLEKIEREHSEESNPKRNLDIMSILPIVTYNQNNLIITSTNVTFDNVPYYIIDVADTVLHSSVLFLQKDVEEVISVSTLYPGIYTIIIEIDGVMFCGEFEVK